MLKKIAPLCLFAASSLWLNATTQSFDFEDPKGINHVVFMLDAPLEFISGSGDGISGIIDFDAATPENTTGEIILCTQSLNVPNEKMTEIMLGNKWLKAEINTDIRFSFDSLNDFPNSKI